MSQNFNTKLRCDMCEGCGFVVSKPKNCYSCGAKCEECSSKIPPYEECNKCFGSGQILIEKQPDKNTNIK